MARDLGVHAHVIERACRDRGDDCSRVRATRGRRTVIPALPGRNHPDDQPYHQHAPSDSHINLRKTSSSFPSEGPRIHAALSSTPYTADTPAGGLGCDAYSESDDTSTGRTAPLRPPCIVAGDGLGGKDRAARVRGTRSAHRPAPSAEW